MDGRFSPSRLILGLATCCLVVSLVSAVRADENIVDEKAKPDFRRDDISPVYRDMMVVQKKAIEKSGKIILHSYGSFDFSDGPVTMYGLNIDIGYAFSDQWEAYLNFTPAFVSIERSVTKKINSLFLQNGERAKVLFEKPKYHIGGSIYWIPAYGKDAWGPRHIIRSDTFFGIGYGITKYETDNGGKVRAVIGKTFFVKEYFNLRLAAGGALVQSVVDNQIESRAAALIEAGLAFYF